MTTKERRTIASEWAEYSRIIPISAGPTQFTETKRAFYAGALALMGCVLTGLSSDAEPTEDDLKYMDSLQREIDEHADAMKRGLVA